MFNVNLIMSFRMKGFKDVNSEAALKTAMAMARKWSKMKDNSTQTSTVDKVEIVCSNFTRTTLF